MNPYRHLGWILLASALSASLRANPFSFMNSSTPDIVVNADLIDRNAAIPTPENPIYYLALVKGYRQFGYEMAGEKPPAYSTVLKSVTKILDHEGYKLATSEHPPSLIILYSWGDFYLNPNPNAHSFSNEMLEFLGANKIGGRTISHTNSFPELDQGLTSLNPSRSTVGGFLDHGLYVLTFWAFDYTQAQQGTARLLWKTNISSSTRGFYLPEVLPTMLAVAAPFLGRETNHPVRIDVGTNYQPRIDLGPLQVLDVDVKMKEKK